MPLLAPGRLLPSDRGVLSSWMGQRSFYEQVKVSLQSASTCRRLFPPRSHPGGFSQEPAAPPAPTITGSKDDYTTG